LKNLTKETNMRDIISLEFFKNLSQYEHDEKYYDFHNDYDCKNISLKDGYLKLHFQTKVETYCATVIFNEVDIISMNFFYNDDKCDLVIDNIYRGRFEEDNNLIDASLDGKGYIYLEFYEGHSLEFWARQIYIENNTDSTNL